jgi:hypothetical protein
MLLLGFVNRKKLRIAIDLLRKGTNLHEKALSCLIDIGTIQHKLTGAESNISG